jgi:hypothetical protein
MITSVVFAFAYSRTPMQFLSNFVPTKMLVYISGCTQSIIYIQYNNAISITGHGDLRGCEVLRIPHCLHSRLTNGGKVAILTGWPSIYYPETFLFLSVVLISVRLRRPQGPVLKGSGLEPVTFQLVA